MELLVPPRRLGRLLAEARTDKGLTVADVCESLGGVVDTVDLLEIELGRCPVEDGVLQTLADLYGLETTSMIPGRSQLVIDLDEGLIEASGATTTLTAAGDATARRDVLTKYLALVYSMRGVEPGTTVTLRLDDLDVLAEALGADRRTIEDELVELMTVTPEPVKKRFRLLRGRTVIPVVGVLVASTATGGLVLTDARDSGAAEPADAPGGSVVQQSSVSGTDDAPVMPVVEISDAAFVERGPDGAPGEIRIRGDRDEPAQDQSQQDG